MSLFTFPGPTVSVDRVARLNELEANRTYENPHTRFVKTDTKKNIVGLLTTFTCFCSNAFDGQVSRLVIVAIIKK